MPAVDPNPLVAEAIHNHYYDKAEKASHSLRQSLLEGRVSLLIGLIFLGTCILIADLLDAGYASNTFLKLLKESLLIGGWVAMWRPMQTFLYGWWPIVRKRKVYLNLSKSIVIVIPIIDAELQVR